MTMASGGVNPTMKDQKTAMKGVKPLLKTVKIV